MNAANDATVQAPFQDEKGKLENVSLNDSPNKYNRSYCWTKNLENEEIKRRTKSIKGLIFVKVVLFLIT